MTEMLRHQQAMMPIDVEGSHQEKGADLGAKRPTNCFGWCARCVDYDVYVCMFELFIVDRRLLV